MYELAVGNQPIVANRDSKVGGNIRARGGVGYGFVGIKGNFDKQHDKGRAVLLYAKCVRVYIYICIAYRVYKPWYKKRVVG